MVQHIHPLQLKDWLEAVRGHGNPVVLDVREPSELAIARIKADGFELITMPMGVIPPRLSELDPDQPVACLCHHGARSMQVANFLKARGFSHVANVTGGINAWSAQVDPSVPRY
ncbi:MAG: sulfurtransferase [Rhodoferax sp.]|nr:sulfurtransferase [Betaproteobacteria bacterium]NCN96595.1 sulfurtransferase [Rhodoferax sp.]OIP20046.1 MAG: sulfurtransferase [Comamonadaceae bacterium CG2_30_57_122]PIZ22272.1 MAG: sulfurtransferase [Comamonadaceae bacterium CG_4_10_14_0_8_um_filter_57_29]PJC16037.1 MAG: sulfurtransferase [Comamonadaceae bacterium CG_4_9_14_0_8_um_filter_57_21]